MVFAIRNILIIFQYENDKTFNSIKYTHLH